MQTSLANQKNNEVVVRNLEMRVRQIAKQLVERQSSQFLANTQTNPKEHCNVITTQSGKIEGERSGDNLVAEKERKYETEGKKNEMKEKRTGSRRKK